MNFARVFDSIRVLGLVALFFVALSVSKLTAFAAITILASLCLRQWCGCRNSAMPASATGSGIGEILPEGEPSGAGSADG